MSPNLDDFPWDSSTESLSKGDKESKLSSTKLVVSSQTFSDKSTSVHFCSTIKRNGYMYKRRKLHRNSPDFLSDGNSTASPNGISGLDSQKFITDLRSQIDSVPNSTCSRICSVGEHERPEQLYTSDFFKYTYECYLRVHGTSSLSKPNVGHGSTSTKIAVGDSCEYPSFDDVTVEPLKLVKEHCSWDSSTESVSIGDKESKLSSTELVVCPQTCSDKLTSMHACSAIKWNGYVYKRRKLQRNSPDLLPEGNLTANPNGISGLDSQKSTDLRSQIELVPNSTCSSICSVREHEEPEQLFTGDFFKYTYECYLGVNGTSSLSKHNVGHGSTSTEIAVGDSGERSSFDDVAVEPLTTFTSVKERCIFVLKSHGFLGGDWTSTSSASLDVMDDNDKISQSCKICGLSEHPIKMLICDLCEEAFHVSCCKSTVKVLQHEKWHCQPCLKKKRKTLWKKHTGKSVAIIKNRKRMWHVESHVSLMLRDVLPYTSKVRIGEEFQAEIPDWSGPIYDKYSDTLSM